MAFRLPTGRFRSTRWHEACPTVWLDCAIVQYQAGDHPETGPTRLASWAKDHRKEARRGVPRYSEVTDVRFSRGVWGSIP